MCENEACRDGWRTQNCHGRRRAPGRRHAAELRIQATRSPSSQCWQSNPECACMGGNLPLNIAEGWMRRTSHGTLQRTDRWTPCSLPSLVAKIRPPTVVSESACMRMAEEWGRTLTQAMARGRGNMLANITVCASCGTVMDSARGCALAPGPCGTLRMGVKREALQTRGLTAPKENMQRPLARSRTVPKET